MERFPVIASITDDSQIRPAMDCEVKRVNLMTGNINTIGGIVRCLQEAASRCSCMWR